MDVPYNSVLFGKVERLKQGILYPLARFYQCAIAQVIMGSF